MKIEGGRERMRKERFPVGICELFDYELNRKVMHTTD